MEKFLHLSLTGLTSIALVAASLSASAQTIASVTNGNATNPLTWDCTCIPLPGMDVTVNHDVTLDNDWGYTTGSLTIGANGSLTGDVPNRGLAVGGGTFTNDGIVDIGNVAVTGGTFSNNNEFTMVALLVAGGTFTNTGDLLGLDSLANDAAFTNSSTGFVEANQLLNGANGTFTNEGEINSVNLGDLGVFNNLSGAFIDITNDFGTGNEFHNHAEISVGNDFGNAGSFMNYAGALLDVAIDWANNDSVGGTATFDNDGMVIVGVDWWNDDIITGSGQFCIGNATGNSGDMQEDFDFCDNSGGAIDWNTGTISASITYCSGNPCAVGVEEALATSTSIEVYPNPFSTTATVTVNGNLSSAQLKDLRLELYDLTGRKVQTLQNARNNQFQLNANQLKEGLYLYRVAVNNELIGAGKVVVE